ncbi:MAG TPA: ROK family protein [Rhodothermales bacterium]|nr:ROK family protein [Rhodothermales bacterium]
MPKRARSKSKSVRALGVDVGGSGVKGAPVDVKAGTLVEKRERIPTPKPSTPEAVAETVAALVDRFDWTGPVGCTIPGRVRNGIVETAANIDRSWTGVDAAALLRERLGRPVAVINDADAAGLAEVRYGAGQDCDGVCLVLTFGTGIGSALFLKSRLVPNLEFGHLELDGQLAERAAASSAREREGMSWEAWAQERVQPYLDHVEFLLSPDLIIIGGGVSRPERWSIFGPLLKTKARLAPAALGNEAGIVGAALMARSLAAQEKAARARKKRAGA